MTIVVVWSNKDSNKIHTPHTLPMVFHKFTNHFHALVRIRFALLCQLSYKVLVIYLVASKGFWAELLGVGDFYYELGVQIVEICMATRPRNGG